MGSDTLTGEIRYRTQRVGLFGSREVLVLQVRVTWPDGPDDWHGMPEYLSGTGWRDATLKDLVGTVRTPNA